MRHYLLEIWQKGVPTPTRVANVVPSVETFLVSSVPDHPVDQRATSDTFAHGDMTALAVQLGLWHGVNTPLIEAIRLETDIVWNQNIILIMVAVITLSIVPPDIVNQ